MDVKFQTLENAEATATLKQHIFKAKECKEQWTREPYHGTLKILRKWMTSYLTNTIAVNYAFVRQIKSG